MTENANLYALFESRFPAADAPFLETDTGKRLTYGDLARGAARMARLLADLGVAPGDRVVVQTEKSAEALVLYLATLKAGAVYVPLNTAYQKGEIAYFLEDAEPRLFVADPAREADLAPLAAAAGVPHMLTLGPSGAGSLMARAIRADADFATVPRGPEDLAAILYTSGTTGRSKGAMLSHRALASNAQVLEELWGFTGQDVLLHALPIFHVHGLFVATHMVLLSGSRMIFLPKFDATQVLELLPRASVMMGVPTFYTRLLDQPGLTAERVAHMRLFISGSAPLLAETHRLFSERTGQAVLERYGMTEAGMITSNPLTGPRVPGTVGPPLPGVELRVVDDQGRALPTGEIGVIEIRGPNLFSGYWRNPAKTAEDMRADGFFITGDVGLVDTQGYVQIVGRAKDLIISGGFNVYPKEIELAIDAIPGVVESAVFGLPHPDFGEAVAAAVIPAAGTRDGSGLTEAAIVAALRDELARFKQPKRVFLVDALPRNAMGKVQKNLLREAYRTTFAAPAKS